MITENLVQKTAEAKEARKAHVAFAIGTGIHGVTAPRQSWVRVSRSCGSNPRSKPWDSLAAAICRRASLST